MPETSPIYTDDEMNLDKKYGVVPPVTDTGGTSIFDLVDDKATTHDLAEVQRRKVSEESSFMSAEERALADDRTLATNFLHREGAGPDDLQKWDTKGEREKYRTDPIEQFGSLASIFAITASAFTKAPMENALNGAAAAMNAARAGNDKEYDRAYQAWKDNNDLVIKRHTMMHQDYSDALELMTRDTATGEALLRQKAAKYGDQQALTLLDHGYAPQLIEMVQARAKAAQGLMQVQMQSDEYTFKVKAFQQWEQKNPKATADQKLAVYEDKVLGAKTDLDREAFRRFVATEPPGEDRAENLKRYNAWYRQHQQDKNPYRNALKPGSREESLALQRAAVTEEHAGEEGWDPSTPQGQAAIDTEANRRVTANRTKRTTAAASQETIDEKAKEYVADGVSKPEAQTRAARWLKVAEAAPSGNRIDQLRGRADQIKYADERVAEVEAMLKRHKAITGLGGKLIGRPGEIIGNVLGSNSTDYKQFERTVNELQLLMPRILTDSSGRPLGAEASHVTSIVAGLNPGDTLQGTMRNFQELQKQLAEMERDTQTRIRGGGDENRPLPPAAAPTSGGSRWQSAPVVE